MKTLSATFPELCVEMQHALDEIGQPELGYRFSDARVRSFESGGKVGYVLLSDNPSARGRTLPLHNSKSQIVLDVATDGTPIGLEVLRPSAALKSILRRGTAV